MKVRLYAGSLRMVEKSGVGQAVLHQEAMLQSMGVETARRNERDVDIVHLNTVFPDSVLSALAARLRGQRVVYYGHSTMEDFRNSFKFSNLLAPLFKRWIKLCYSTGDVIITPTDYSKKLLLSYGVTAPVYALSNGVDTDFFCPDPLRRRAFREKYGLRPEDRAVISVGHYIVRKGILDFIELARSLPDTRFFWFGYTNLKLVPTDVRAAIESAPANLCFPGYVGREALRDAYCGCDLFCFMSYEETEGIVVLEALSCGVPTLVRDIPVYAGWLRHGTNVYKGRDAATFRALAVAMLSGCAPDLTQAGRETAAERSIQEMGKQLLRVYSTLAAVPASALLARRRKSFSTR